MRIRKSPRKESLLKGVRNSIALTPHERLIWKDVHELISSSDKEIAGQLYVQHVMKPLLGSKYVDAGVCTHCFVVSATSFSCAGFCYINGKLLCYHHIGNPLTQNGCFYHLGCLP